MARRGVESQGLGDTILSFLRQRGEAASSHMLAERFLKAAVSSEELATRLMRPVLETMGAHYVADVGWVVDVRVPGASRAETPTFAAVMDAAIGHVHLVPIDGDHTLLPLPHGAALPAGANLVMLEPRVDVGTLRHWLRREGLPEPASIISLRSVVRGVVRVSRDAGLSEFCSALGVRWLDTEDPAGAAVAMAACVAEVVARRSAAGNDDVNETAVVLPAGITQEMLATLPESPGVYRFHDADGDLLYVGKAVNLKRRISSYFTPAAARRPRRFQGKIDHLTHEVVGSELEALLKEARLIEQRAPSGNIQVQVHERGAGYESARAFAVLLPDAAACAVSVILVRDGHYLGHARIGPRGGGLAGARK